MEMTTRQFTAPRQAAPAYPSVWDILGPLPAGKLEVDADPTFDSHIAPGSGGGSGGSGGSGGTTPSSFDAALHVLTIPHNTQVFSELAPAGVTSWRSVRSREPHGQVDVRFSDVNWNEISQGVSTAAAYEFQGWARAYTYVNKDGIYSLHCQGVHTVYVRNSHTTRMLSGDVYKGGAMFASVDLKTGPVGLVLPLRGAAQSTFACTISPEPTPSSQSLMVLPPTHVPHLVHLPPSMGGVDSHGMLLSSLFVLPITNTQSHPVSVTVSIAQPRGLHLPGTL